MRILHLSTHDVTGGAARAAHRLHRGLLGVGAESRMFVFGRAGEDPEVIRFRPTPTLSGRVRRRIRRRRITADFERYRSTRPRGYEQFSDDRTEYDAEVMRQLPPCDVVNLHWIAGFVDLGAFFTNLPRGVPVVWTLHDMNAFTGGCHYDDYCGKFADSCGACPQLGSRDEQDLSRAVWRRKHDALAGIPPPRLHVVGDSHWLTDRARCSSLLKRFPVSTIHYGLDTEVFTPREKSAARQALGIPAEARVLLFVADSVENRRKGFPLLVRALEGLNHPDLFLISIGRGSPGIPAGLPHLHFGRIGEDRLLSVVYSAADLFVIPSLQEAYGQTALEALACGTPAVGFDAGGIPDIIRPGVTGLLARTGDADALREAIAALLGAPAQRMAMAENGRRLVVEEHSLEAQARRYLALYEDLLSGTR
ncbi:MAG TPA: glycosyltransferase family 4 protein [Longimicrobiaceae bacterium]|nr:glycosyltransferase family 4 protein [Longimicrobiaceae bacterium]